MGIKLEKERADEKRLRDEESPRHRRHGSQKRQIVAIINEQKVEIITVKVRTVKRKRLSR